MKGLIPWSFALLLSVGSLLLPAFAEEKATGHYYWEREVESFIPCGSDNAFWVLGEKSVLQPLRDKVIKLGDHQPIYVEVSGHFEDNADSEGAAADYDGLYRIESVIASTPDSPATCPVLVMGD